MQRISRTVFTLLMAALTTAFLATPHPAQAADVAQIERDAIAALAKLYDTTPAAKVLGDKAKAILVFPSILKAGLIIGGQGGNGALFVDGKVVGFYNTAAASYGLQAGAQEFAYAMFLMTDSAIESVKKADGWEVGVGPSLVLVDEGVAKSLTTTTAKDDVYAFIFGQKGLMAGIGIQGSKITKINP
ncbi:MAG: lipid-binding SYLF domain-containing protein [Haliea sp.]|nr:lipid-binding SYLF domain-containing protein [Haliea sp.]